MQVENSVTGCRAEGSASTKRFVADGVEGGRKDDLSEGGAVLRWYKSVDNYTTDVKPYTYLYVGGIIACLTD